MSRIRPPLSPETKRATQHDITLAIRHVRNGHHHPILTRQGPNEAPASRCGLLYKVDRDRAPSHHIRTQRPKFHTEKHSMPVRSTELHRI